MILNIDDFLAGLLAGFCMSSFSAFYCLYNFKKYLKSLIKNNLNDEE